MILKSRFGKSGGLIRARIFVASAQGSSADVSVSRIGLVKGNGERADTSRGITSTPVVPAIKLFTKSRRWVISFFIGWADELFTLFLMPVSISAFSSPRRGEIFMAAA